MTNSEEWQVHRWSIGPVFRPVFRIFLPSAGQPRLAADAPEFIRWIETGFVEGANRQVDFIIVDVRHIRNRPADRRSGGTTELCRLRSRPTCDLLSAYTAYAPNADPCTRRHVSAMAKTYAIRRAVSLKKLCPHAQPPSCRTSDRCPESCRSSQSPHNRYLLSTTGMQDLVTLAAAGMATILVAMLVAPAQAGAVSVWRRAKARFCYDDTPTTEMALMSIPAGSAPPARRPPSRPPYATPAAPDLAAYVLSHDRYDAVGTRRPRNDYNVRVADVSDRRVRVPAEIQASRSCCPVIRLRRISLNGPPTVANSRRQQHAADGGADDDGTRHVRSRGS